MKGREFLGELEEMVLLAAVRLGEGAYGAAILRELDEEAGRDVPRGSVYITLERLESKGLVESRRRNRRPAGVVARVGCSW